MKTFITLIMKLIKIKTRWKEALTFLLTFSWLSSLNFLLVFFLLVFVSLALVNSVGWTAQEFRKPKELQLISPFDRFTLKLVGGQYTFNNKPVSLGSLDQIIPFLATEFEDPCPSTLTKPDLTLKASLETGKKAILNLFIEQGYMSDGTHCARTTGEGIYFVPLHRSWFENTTTMTIPLESPFKLMKGHETLALFEKENGEWKNGASSEYANWDFFANFRDSLKDFTITHLVHPAIRHGQPTFSLFSGKHRYDFYKLGETLWVAQVPQYKWLIGSSRWSIWMDMEKSQWIDRSNAQLQFITNKSHSLDDRKGTLASLAQQWSPSIGQALKQILFDQSEAAELKIEALRVLKQKPTLDNMGLLLQALDKNQDPTVQYELSQALRIRNPKGPLLSPDLDEEQRHKALESWKKWWKERQDAKHVF